MTKFKEEVLAVVQMILKGKTMSYGEVASKSGHPGAYRAVANLMKSNCDESISCHRVVYSNGRVGKYNRSGGEEVKIKRLKSEGVVVVNKYVQDSKYNS